MRWLGKLNFEMIDGFFRQYLLGTTGIKSRDQKRREANQKRGSQPFDSGRDPVKASASLEQLFGEFNWTSQLAQATLFTDWGKVEVITIGHYRILQHGKLDWYMPVN